MKSKFGILILALIATTSCFADAAPVAEQANPMSQLIFFGAIFAVFYFFMIRPQSKRAKEHKNLISGISKGDEVITTGGILGKISKVTDSFFIVTISDGVEITVQKQAVATALPKGTLKTI